MQNKLIIRTVLLFLLTTCFTLTLQNSSSKSHRPPHSFISKPAAANPPLSPKQVDLRISKRAIITPSRKPGFFRTLFSVIYEQWRDTKDTFGKVNEMINNNFLPDNAPIIVETTTPSNDPNVTTSKVPYRISRKEFNKIVQRNLKGLIRLYNIELNDALRISKKTDLEYRKNASIEVSKFL